MTPLHRWKAAYLVLLFCAARATSSPAQTFTTLANFDGTSGEGPWAGLVQGTDGTFYGTTYNGANTACKGGCGTIFRITARGKLTVLHSFDKTDGGNPYAPLIQGTNGNFYGSTESGGAHDNCPRGCGTVFTMTTGETLTTLHSFGSFDGAIPVAGLVQSTDGSFYGTTSNGGANTEAGTVFKISPGGTLKILHTFNYSGGAFPMGALVQAIDGNFYGTTTRGGPTCALDSSGCGTFFKMTPGGTLTTLHFFDGTEGAFPLGTIVQSTDGNFYGTTSNGGANNGCFEGCGTVFKVTTAGALTTLHSFSGSDGSAPFGGLVQGTDGNFYGTTTEGGDLTACSNGCGTVFKITPSGTLTTLHTFNLADGANPNGLMQATSGNFYGTTNLGGTSTACTGCGTVFTFSVGLGPFVKTLPTSANVGTRVIILGTNLVGATSVTFNGTPATFTVVSATEIRTTVPAGATTGTVEVTTPSGTLASNVVFQVL